MKADEITTILHPVRCHVTDAAAEVTTLLTDSRRLGVPVGVLFFAITTKHNTGCKYVQELYDKGVRQFVVPADAVEEYLQQFERCTEANFWYVKNVVAALQQLAARHRAQYNIPIVGITGSNGKTIVKDWIVQMLSADRRVVASPKSYNSQIGVPLSVWQMSENDQVGVFEVGISEPTEMELLRNVLNPTIGVFTNIGQAHDENFLTREQKIGEKLQLFTRCKTLIYCADHKEIHSVVMEKHEAMQQVCCYTWGRDEQNAVQLLESQQGEHDTLLRIRHNGKEQEFRIPFIDRASAENAMHCITLLYNLGYDGDVIAARCSSLTPVAMRMEINEAVNDCVLVNDSYSLDLNSLAIALEFVEHERQHPYKTLIMSDFVQSGLPEHELYEQVCTLLKQRGISKFIGIGEALCRNQESFAGLPQACFFRSTEEFERHYDFDGFRNEMILLKGARIFHFENIAKLLQRKSHETTLEVNLDALVRNLNYYRSLIKPSTKMMAMVKAASYGAGKTEIASILQFNHVDYLTVAYSDEGVELRRNGIILPIMVMNPEEESFGDMIRYHLEPDIYSFRIFRAFSETAALFCKDGEKVPVHIELDTGMHRLGFMQEELDEVIALFRTPDCVLQVRSIFSHFACADDPAMDSFTRGQIEKFRTWSSYVKKGLGQPDVMCHICNSSGIARFPEAQMDMVRLGIGLYGIAPEEDVQAHLTPVSRLKTRVSQVKSIPMGDSVGYSRRWIAERPSRIAIIPIGYADGLHRSLGNGNGCMEINGHEVPIVGSICMDMCFVDVTDIDCREGDEVTVFGSEHLLKQLAASAHTITYEILTNVAPRVKRVYYQE